MARDDLEGFFDCLSQSTCISGPIGGRSGALLVKSMVTFDNSTSSGAGQLASKPAQSRAHSFSHYTKSQQPTSNPSNDAGMDYLTKACATNISGEREPLMNIKINLKMLEDALGLISNKAAPGLESIPTMILNTGGIKIKMFHVKLFRVFMDEIDIALSLRLALISPIFKGGESEKCIKYCPIALTGHVTQILKGSLDSRLLSTLRAWV